MTTRTHPAAIARHTLPGLPGLPGLLLSLGLAGCAAGSPSETPSDPIRITITGVEDGRVYGGPVTIGIAASRGTYRAELNGEAFASGHTVAAFGPHALAVTARDGTDTVAATVRFELARVDGTWLIVRMIDLGANGAGGGGDAILLTDSAESVALHALVDAGPAGPDGSRPGHVAERLGQLGVDALEAAILTHAHSDHFDGLPAVLAAVPVERFVYNGQVRSYGAYAGLVARAEAAAGSLLVPASPLEIRLGSGPGTAITVLPPLADHLSDPDAGSSELNDGSLGAEVSRPGFRMFLTGDGEAEANTRWRTSFAARSADVNVLKVGHHGGNDAIFDDGFDGASSWLEHTSPETLLISANGTTHPREHALTRILGRSDARTYCTSVHGDIVVRVSPLGDYAVSVERNGALDCVAGSEADT